MNGKILVTGGAGYIGSHIVRMLAESGSEIVIVDDLSEGHAAAVPGIPLVRADFADAAMLDSILGDGKVAAIVHMAAFCEVGQSVKDPASYYRNNLSRSLDLLDAAVRHGVRDVVFSSTAAVYGEPDALPITEIHDQRPTNPYGETKLAVERALGWYYGAYGLRSVSLRYFNAAGAHPSAEIGEDHANETHLIPRLLLGVLHGSEAVPIFGRDYPTPDGTCVRDYIHVVDLARAHLLALEALATGRVGCEAFNLGNGAGFSVLDVIETVGRITGTRPATRDAERRAGDPASLVASSARIAARLGWRPSFDTLDEIVGSAWGWHRGHPRGYATNG
ncbi:MAG TPA: UDP-glucose 4-epimerase GalE [Candidatus Polarisedimenticolaceae bacterium]|nr:UDP-glucose 4-epimerase GalE [Candidatus Polarisedimenticolaceae bacterium]